MENTKILSEADSLKMYNQLNDKSIVENRLTLIMIIELWYFMIRTPDVIPFCFKNDIHLSLRGCSYSTVRINSKKLIRLELM
jgi:hypothetical protein